MEKQLFAWNDRRAAQNLPPSAEAVALLDLHQVVHQKFVGEVVADPNLDPPIAGYDDLKPIEEKERLKQTWNNIVEHRGVFLIDKKNQQFTEEMLANFSRLLASQAGKYLINQLNERRKHVKVIHAKEMAAKPSNPTSSRYDKGTKQPRDGSGTELLMPTGSELLGSNDVSYTENGNYLYNPSFIGLGHELIHALHFSRGKGRGEMPADVQNDEWHDQEEYRTISKGKTTENTLRHQYGLTLERFGHGDVAAKDEINVAFANALKASKELADSERRLAVEKNLQEKNLDPKLLSDVKKLEYEHRSRDSLGSQSKKATSSSTPG